LPFPAGIPFRGLSLGWLPEAALRLPARPSRRTLVL
jgi:hypothetical protein